MSFRDLGLRDFGSGCWTLSLWLFGFLSFGRGVLEFTGKTVSCFWFVLCVIAC